MMLPCGCPTQFPDWNKQDVDIGGYLAHILSVPMFMHMPIGHDIYVKRQQQVVARLGLQERWPGMTLIRTGFFRGSHMRLLENSRSPASNLRILPRPFRLRAMLHEGNLSTGRKVVRQMQMDLVDTGKIPKELYLCYLTCPQCSEQRGSERLLFLRRWEESALLKKRLQSRQ